MCPICGRTVRNFTINKDTVPTILSVQMHKEVVAFGHDTHTGQPMWLDKKGNKVRADDPAIRYDLKNDKHGWKVTGKKVAPFDDRGRPNI